MWRNRHFALEALHRRYEDRGLVVIGFPSNDFNQEFASNREIAEFCRLTSALEPYKKSGGFTRRVEPAASWATGNRGGGGNPGRWRCDEAQDDRIGTPYRFVS
jgi:hypothetical protein